MVTRELAPGEELPRLGRGVTAQTGAWPPPGTVDGHAVRNGPTRAATVRRDAIWAHADAVAEVLRAEAGALGHGAR